MDADAEYRLEAFFLVFLVPTLQRGNAYRNKLCEETATIKLAASIARKYFEQRDC